jgi:flagellar assembly factor FliW
LDQYPLQYPVFAHKEDVIVSFPKGLIGFPELHSFRLFEPQGSYPLKFLQAVDQQEISFVCVDVAAIKSDYEFPLNPEDAKFLALEKFEDALVLALVVIPEDPRQMTANLAGPLVINIRTRMGRQVVLSTDSYPLRHPLFSDVR